MSRETPSRNTPHPPGQSRRSSRARYRPGIGSRSARSRSASSSSGLSSEATRRRQRFGEQRAALRPPSPRPSRLCRSRECGPSPRAQFFHQIEQARRSRPRRGCRRARRSASRPRPSRPASATLSEPVNVSTMISPNRTSAMRSAGSITRFVVCPCGALIGRMLAAPSAAAEREVGVRAHLKPKLAAPLRTSYCLKVLRLDQGPRGAGTVQGGAPTAIADLARRRRQRLRDGRHRLDGGAVRAPRGSRSLRIQPEDLPAECADVVAAVVMMLAHEERRGELRGNLPSRAPGGAVSLDRTRRSITARNSFSARQAYRAPRRR